MTDQELIQASLNYLNQLQIHFSIEAPGSSDELKMKTRLREIIAYLARAKSVNNALLIEMEKFYRSFSFLVGLGSAKLEEEAYKAWRAYDAFHYDTIKPQLQVYGGGIYI